MKVVLTPYRSKNGAIIASVGVNGTFQIVFFTNYVKNMNIPHLCEITQDGKVWKCGDFRPASADEVFQWKTSKHLIIPTLPYVEFKFEDNKFHYFVNTELEATFQLSEWTEMGLGKMAEARYFLPNLNKQLNQKLIKLIIKYHQHHEIIS